MSSVPETAGGYVALTGYIEPEDDGFNAYCPELGVASCGDTIEEALDNLGEALEIFCEDLADIGTLAREFRKGGVEVQTGPWPTDSVTVSVPIGKIARVYILPVPLSAAV